MQQIAIEKDYRAGLDLHRDGVVIAVWKVEGFLGAVKAHILLVVGAQMMPCLCDPGITHKQPLQQWRRRRDPAASE